MVLRLSCCRPAFIVLAALLAGLQIDLSTVTATTVNASSGKGVITGHIDRCSGLPLPASRRYSAGSVTVLQGQMRWKHGNHLGVPIFPTHAVKTARITAHQSYRFTLAPGHYVLRARLPHSNVVPFVQVAVKRGVTTHVDIPNMCI
ncbi:MAG TPA: hypothetical protein VF898_12390 [Chloroflexota bacterium]